MTAIEPEVTGTEALQALAAEHLAGEFRIMEHLGRGAWGERFHAEDLHRAEEVVLTLLPPIEGEEWKEEERFLEALRAATLLDHPHLAPIRAYGVSGPLRWFAALASGDLTLAERVAKSGPMSMAVVRRIAQQLASALDQSHRRGLAHGALTVHDVRIDAHGWVHLEEVGVGVTVEPPPEGADQVGLAEVVRYCLTGGVESAPLPPEVDAAVYAAILRATRPRPSDRFRDLLEFVAALDGVGTVAQPMRPTIPVGKRIRAADWEELLDTEPEAPTPSRRPFLVRSVVAIGLLALITAAIPIGRRLTRPDEGRISYPRPSLVALEPENIAPVPEPSPPPVEPAAPVLTPKRAPVPVRRPAPTRTPLPAPRQSLPPEAPPTLTLPSAPVEPPSVAPGVLAISSTPWAELSIDGTLVGNTPLASVPLAPGRHHLRLTRDGFEPLEIDVDVRSGETVRLAQLTLKELKL